MKTRSPSSSPKLKPSPEHPNPKTEAPNYPDARDSPRSIPSEGPLSRTPSNPGAAAAENHGGYNRISRTGVVFITNPDCTPSRVKVL